MFLGIFILIIGLGINGGRILFRWSAHLGTGIKPLLFGSAYGFSVILILAAFIASRVPGIAIPRFLLRLAHYGLGLLLYVILVVNTLAALLFLGRLLGFFPAPLPGTVSRVSLALSLLLVLAFSLYGSLNAGPIRTRSYTVQLGENQGDMDSLRIVLASDFHLGYVVEEKHLGKIVAAINAADADLVCLAGDIFDGDMTALADPKRLQELLGEIRAKHGVYACLGNHDAGGHYRQMVEFLEAAGIRLLEDDTAIIDKRVLLVGRKDSSPIGGQGIARKAVALPPVGLPVIVMDHQPGNVGEYGKETDLVLCGHSHRGQVFPFNLVTKAVYLVDYGYYQEPGSGTQFVVTSGAGTWGPPFRVGSENEVVVIDVLFPAEAEGR